jgi:hypothetical protein
VLDRGKLLALEEFQRERSRPDLQRVLFDSAFALGIFGAGWVAVKLGQAVMFSQDAARTAGALLEDPVGTVGGIAEKRTANTLLVWVTGAKKDVPVGRIPNSFARIKVRQLRSQLAAGDTAEIEEIEAEADAEVIERTPEQEGQVKLLGALDRFYGEWGGVLPPIIVGTITGLELLRVRRMRE